MRAVSLAAQAKRRLKFAHAEFALRAVRRFAVVLAVAR
jgi:hypothetical protein